MKPVKIIFFISLCIGLVALALFTLSRNDSASRYDSALMELKRSASLCQDASQSCWHGIFLAKTTFDEAERLLQNDGTVANIKRSIGEAMRPNSKGSGMISSHYLLWETKWIRGSACCYYEQSDVPIERISLELRASVRLGDVIDWLGQPQGFDIYARPSCYPYTVYNIVLADVVFNDVVGSTTSLGDYNTQTPQMWHLTPDTDITLLTYNPPDRLLTLHWYPWQGFPTRGPLLEWKCDLMKTDARGKYLN